MAAWTRIRLRKTRRGLPVAAFRPTYWADQDDLATILGLKILETLDKDEVWERLRAIEAAGDAAGFDAAAGYARVIDGADAAVAPHPRAALELLREAFHRGGESTVTIAGDELREWSDSWPPVVIDACKAAGAALAAAVFDFD